MKNQYKKSIIFFALIFTIGFGLISFPKISLGENITSDGKYTVLAPLPCIEGSGIECNGPNGGVQERVDFKTYVQYTFNLLIGLSAVTAVILIVWSGIQYIVSTSILNKQSSLDRAKNALIGLVLILTSFIILRTVDPRFTEIPNTLVPKIEISSFLAQNSYDILLDKINKDTPSLESENAILTQETKENKSKQEETAAKIKEIDKQIAKLDPKKPSDKEKIEALQREKTKLSDQNGIERTKTETSRFATQVNEYLQLTNAKIAEPINLKDEKQIANLMNLLSNNQENILKSKDVRLAQLADVENADTKQIERAAAYGTSIIELDKIRLTSSSARQVSVGATYNTKIQTWVVGPDGKILIADGSEVRNNLLHQVGVIENKLKDLEANDSYFVKLTQEIQDTKNRINDNNLLK